MGIPDKSRIKEYNTLVKEKNKYLTEKELLLRKLQELDNNVSSVDERIKKWGVNCYKNEEERNKIIDEAEVNGFSKKTIDLIRSNCSFWNDDNLTPEIIEQFPKMEIRIYESTPSHNTIGKVFGSILEKTGNFMSNGSDKNDDII